MHSEKQTSSGSRTQLRAVLAGLFTVLTFAFGMTPAWAHDHLESTSPSDGSTVTAPTQVVLHLAEPPVTTGTEMKVTGPQGDMAGTLQIAGSDVAESFAAPLPAGAYTVLWRVTSDDGHPVSGQFRFTVAATSGSAQSGAAQSGATTRSANASALTAPASSGSDSATSTSPTPPAKQTPTDKTDNSPLLVIGGAALALIVIAAIALVSRSRLKNDE